MQHLKYFENNATAVITFSRPNALNALNSDVFTELNLILEKLEQSEKIQVLVLTGEGKAFVAGADIAEMKGKNATEAAIFSRMGHQIFNRLEHLPQVVIGAVNGFALGGGLELALACDFLLASDKAKFSAPEINLGLIPGFCGTWRLPRVIGLNNARYYLLTAAMFDAAEAHRLGLVQQVYPPSELMNEVMKTSELMASKGPGAMKALKRVLLTGQEKGLKDGCEQETEEFAHLFSGEAQEGMQAFLEKRPPEW